MDAPAGRRREWRRAVSELNRRWDAMQDNVPEPLLRLLVMLPWLLRRMPVPFWVPLALLLLRRWRRRRTARQAVTERHRSITRQP